ncbi:MAG: hypothetical protein DHS20C06_04060 [Hyphobacterium sp.]|nr:MAG: hypothetical protein DHS20C06_04060 [Hyphobacterium sp.]
MRILVLGGYGLIGAALSRRLIADGHEVTGLGRKASVGARLIPAAAWKSVDIARLTTTQDWLPIITDFDAVVNASGALQSGGRDNVTAVQSTAIIALINACETADVSRFIQISATMAAIDADTDFMRSKGEADTHLRTSKLAWTLFRPGLVIAPGAYGGTALLRMLAALPGIGLMAFGDRRIQSIGVDDIAAAVSTALVSLRLVGVEADLVEDNDQRLTDVVVAIRRWLGWPDYAFILNLPRWVTSVAVMFADMAGQLGWRSPLRGNAVKVLDRGIFGNAVDTRVVLGRSALSLVETLAATPTTIADRWHARLSLAFPIVLTGLILFWLVSGLIAVFQFSEAARVLNDSAVGPLAGRMVAGGIAADLAIAIGLAFRRTTALALKSAIGLTLVYLALGSWLTPELWIDPLGPFAKSTALILFHLMLLPLLEER